MLQFWRIMSQVLSFVLAIWLCYNTWIFGHIVYWRYHNPSSTAFMRAHEQSAVHHPIQQRWIPYLRISSHLKHAVIAAEDAKFMMHHGFDWTGMKKAIKKNIQHKKVVAGGSTISQQLAKNLFLSNKKTLWRKIEEAIITMMLETTMHKHRILEIYLNTIEWGEGIFGVEAASKHYFNVSATNLTRAQAAKLAAMISNPCFYDANRYTRKLTHKTHAVMRRMRSTQVPSLRPYHYNR
ncbi:MAG: monofunctional biosynthetic peptidoglycan transglycosylase [Neisseriales bacterium]|nr:MAG: monofunctional biosynthetic peptidoglycan transglycosylase [Neisseriales bacterium]